MGLFDRLSFRAEKELAVGLVDALSKDIPVTLTAGKGKPLTVNRITRLLERACEAACAHRDQHGMGMIGRAVFANTFKWQLKGKGYSEDFVGTATEVLIVALSKK